MDRRNFIQRATVAGASGITAASAAPAEANKTATFQVKGFTCITCAIGLEVVLREQKGVVRAKASYPEQRVVIGFDSTATSEDALRTFINKTTGFTVKEESAK